MSPTPPVFSRLRAYLRFVVAVLWFFLARSIAHRGAFTMATEQFQPLVEQAMLLFLLLTGYAGLGMMLDGDLHPIRNQGLPRRAGCLGEVGLGLAVGWSLAVACVLVLVVGGGIAIVLITGYPAWGWLLADAAFFALLALAEEVAFRGYGFQCLERALGPWGAALGFAAYYSIVQALVPGSNRASFAVSLALSFLLSLAYLRSRALWVSWGLNFGWKASRALVFGLTISGVSNHSPVVEGNPMGSFWLTGGGFGLDGSWVTVVLLLAALPVVYRFTRDLDYQYNAPVIVPAGIPLDLDGAARRQHEAGIALTAPVAHTTSASGLVQILPVSASAQPETPQAE